MDSRPFVQINVEMVRERLSSSLVVTNSAAESK